MRGLLTTLLLVFVACIFASAAFSSSPSPNYRPVVLWHGMGDTCCNPLSMGYIKRVIEKQLPGIYVHSLRIGDNIIADEFNGFLMNVNDQIEYAKNVIGNDSRLANGFNAMGFSQGGQFLRAYIERYNKPAVYNYISIGGQHQGVFGFPRCPGTNETLCEIVRRMLNLGAYVPFVQDHLVQAEYWQDPLNEAEYLAKNIFLPDINNNNNISLAYKDNLLTLQNFVMVKFENDTMVQPVESEWFGFYTPGQDKEITTLQESPLYQEDWLGLKQLDEQNRLIFLQTEGDHLQFTEEWFIENLIPYLNNTL